MPSTRSPRNSSSSKKHSPIINKTIDGGILKRKKSALSPKSPSAITPNRHTRRPKSKQLASLLRGIQGAVKHNVSEYCGRAEPELTEDVTMEDMSEFSDFAEHFAEHFAEPDAMDLREDYEWDYPGFDGYLLQEYNAKIEQFPEMWDVSLGSSWLHSGETRC